MERIESPKINPHTYNQFIYSNGAKNIQWRKDNVLSTLNQNYVPCCIINIFSGVGLISILLIQLKWKFWETKRPGGWSKTFLLLLCSLFQTRLQNTLTCPLCVCCLSPLVQRLKMIWHYCPSHPSISPNLWREWTQRFLSSMHLISMTKAFCSYKRISMIDSDNS